MGNTAGTPKPREASDASGLLRSLLATLALAVLASTAAAQPSFNVLKPNDQSVKDFFSRWEELESHMGEFDAAQSAESRTDMEEGIEDGDVVTGPIDARGQTVHKKPKSVKRGWDSVKILILLKALWDKTYAKLNKKYGKTLTAAQLRKLQCDLMICTAVTEAHHAVADVGDVTDPKDLACMEWKALFVEHLFMCRILDSPTGDYKAPPPPNPLRDALLVEKNDLNKIIDEYFDKWLGQ